MKVTPQKLKWLLNFYPPYIGAGIKIPYISQDWRELHVSMRKCWYNRNAVGTHFGGSLYSMVDPHLMLMLMQILGKEYIVWDQAADIEFVKATKHKVTSVIKISDEDVHTIIERTANGEKFLPEFMVQIVDDNGELIARVKKVLYVRRKREK